MALGVLGVVLVLVGALWVLQGIGIAKGSFMTDHAQWAFIGAAVIVVGVALVAVRVRGARGTEPPPD
jgi:hypothetical protein